MVEGVIKALFVLILRFFHSCLMVGDLILMLFMRVTKISKVPFWVGRRGIEWIRSCFVDIRDWVLGKDLLCKCYRENNKFYEFCGR